MSSERQKREGLSIGTQEKQLRSAAPTGYAKIIWYPELGVSGRKLERPARDRLLHDLEPGDLVIVTALDRFGRSTADLIAKVEEIRRCGAQFVSLRENVDTTNPLGKFFFTLVAAFAELESDLIGERVRDNFPAMLRKLGRKPGGRRKYGRNPDGSINQREASVIRSLIVPSHLAGQSELTISRKLNEDGIVSASGGEWHAGSLPRLLRRPDLAGLVRIEGELVEGSEKPILDRETWDQVQQVFRLRGTRPERRGRLSLVPFLLDKPLRATCGSCGGPMGLRSGNLRKDRSRQASFVCLNRERNGLRHGCPMGRVPRENVEETLLGIFQRDLFDETATLREIERAARVVASDSRKVLAAAERDEMNLATQLNLVKGRFRNGEITADEWREERAEIATERQAAASEAEQLRRRVEEVTGAGTRQEATHALLATVREIRKLATDLGSAKVPDRTLLDAVRVSIARVVQEVVIVDADLPIGYLGAPQLVIPAAPQDGDEVSTVLRLHGIGVQGRRLAIEVVPRGDNAVAENVAVDGQTVPAFRPARAPLATAHNLTLTSQNTSRRPRRTIRSSSKPALQTLTPRMR